MIKNEQRAQGNDFGAGAKGFERGNAVRLSLAAAKLDYKSQSIRRLPVTGYLTSHPKSDFPEICDLIGPLVKCYPTWHLSKNSKKKSYPIGPRLSVGSSGMMRLRTSKRT